MTTPDEGPKIPEVSPTGNIGPNERVTEKASFTEEALFTPSDENLRRMPWKTILFIGIALIILGTLMIALPFLATLAVELVLGTLLLVGGIVQTFELLRKHRAPGFGWRLLIAILYAITGLLLLIYPWTGIITLTLILSGFFLAEGLVKIVWSFQLRKRPNSGWGWVLFSGIIALILGFLIWSEWPLSSFWVIGLLAGIDLLFSGWALVMIALAFRTAFPKEKAS